MQWTEERIELLKKFWLEGLTASQISDILGEGLSRSAVIGKVRRLKLVGRPNRSANAKKGHARRVRFTGAHAQTSNLTKARSKNFVEPLPQHVDVPAPVSLGLTLNGLSEETCKWPNGDPLSKDFNGFCGQPSLKGKPYCEFHSGRAYYKLDKSKNLAGLIPAE